MRTPVCPPYPHEHDPLQPPGHLMPTNWDPTMFPVPAPQPAPPFEPSRHLGHHGCCSCSHEHSPVTVYHANTKTGIHHPPPLPPRSRQYSLDSNSGHSHASPVPYPPQNQSAREFAPRRRQIFFYNKHDPHYGFTNFSAHPVVYNGRKYPTSEHLFQSLKFSHRPDLAEHIRTFSSKPSVALSEARRFAPEARSDWLKVNVAAMDETILHKFTQHRSLKEELLATGEAELIEDSDKDSFWGIGADRKGRNELGLALMRLRERLAAQRD